MLSWYEFQRQMNENKVFKASKVTKPCGGGDGVKQHDNMTLNYNKSVVATTARLRRRKKSVIII